MKIQADKHRQDRSFKVGDWVYLRLQPYRQRTLAYKGKWKLSPRFFGPFQVLLKVGAISYRLDLPPKAKIYLVFHVSCLKLKLGQKVHPIPTLPPMDADGQVRVEPIKVLQTKSRSLRSQFNGLAVRQRIPRGSHYISFKFPSLTLWARCFNRGGNVRHLSYICVIGYKCVCVCVRAHQNRGMHVQMQRGACVNDVVCMCCCRVVCVSVHCIPKCSQLVRGSQLQLVSQLGTCCIR